MPHRAASPALSEQGFDISTALLPNISPSKHDSAVARRENSSSAATPNDVEIDISVNDTDDDENDDEAYIAAQQAASNRKSTNVKGKSVKKGGAFQSMGLDTLLLKAITRKGFTVPTPIQRKAIPLILESRDVVGMARTGSGKTAAFVIPMIQKLKTHSAKVGARAIVLSPSRELALQTLKTMKEFGRGTDLSSVLLVGGDSLEDQFAQMTSNPDILIATPGRFMHLLVEMSLDISSIRYVVFDEADRLFEMGFATQLHEILHALPPSRQTLLFSATLPKSLVEFAKAGLKDPELVRLDTESKISPDLESAFFSIKSAERDGALLHILQDVIKMPTGSSQVMPDGAAKGKKRKREPSHDPSKESPTKYSTIVFAATKHHVEYLAHLLRAAGYEVSYVYGSLDQTARKMQVEAFRSGVTKILIVTDVAARGIDIPMLANVINYNFPPQPKIFVHRVGRTARAGRTGWSYSLVQEADMPYLLDLQLFLSRKLITGRDLGSAASFSSDLVLGGIPHDQLASSCEAADKLLEDDDLANLRGVAIKGEKLYMRTRNSASTESVKRARTVLTENLKNQANVFYQDADDKSQTERDSMLARISGFRPAETVFEMGKRGTGTEAAEKMRRQKTKMAAKKQRLNNESLDEVDEKLPKGAAGESFEDGSPNEQELTITEFGDVESEDDVEVAYQSNATDGQEGNDNMWQDAEHFMTYQPRSADLNEERGYGVNSGANFTGAAREVSMNLANDESRSYAEPSRVRWDKRTKKYVPRANDTDGSKGAKTIQGESGQKLAATFRSGRFDAWRKANRIERMPRTGEMEVSRSNTKSGGMRKFKHFAERAPKQPDKYRDDYYKKKKKQAEAKAQDAATGGRDKAKNELRGVSDVHKQRQLQAKRREKNARPSRKKKRG